MRCWEDGNCGENIGVHTGRVLGKMWDEKVVIEMMRLRGLVWEEGAEGYEDAE